MPRGENRLSILLSKEENDQVFNLIGSKCQSLATAVVQLFTTEAPSHSEWRKKDTGILCLIKDNGKRSYFFRIYCLYRKALIWEHEVYMEIEYKSPRTYLHTFEAEDYMTAFNFASEDEARVLRNILIEKIELRKQRREERRQRSMLAARANSAASNNSHHAPRQNGVAHTPPPPPAPALMPKANVSTGNYTLKPGKKKPTRKLTKADIGAPKDFKHISHVGWDANKGFDVGNLPEDEMRSFFSKAGVSETELQDQETRQFIYEFINKNGGIDAVKEELHESQAPEQVSNERQVAAPPVPSRSPAPPHPPAPPSRAPPPPPARAVPPPPRNPPPPRPLQPPPSSGPPPVPPPPPPVGAPPPPPPPPPLAPPPPPAPPAGPLAAPAAAGPPDPRAMLMESIRSGNKNLKHVEVHLKPAVNEDNRSNLLSEIRQGVELRAVSRAQSGEGADAGVRRATGGDGLAGALARALEERNRAIHSDSDDDDSDATTSDGEWDY